MSMPGVLSIFFLPLVVGKCMWVTSIQQGAKLRSLTTPSDEAFCLLVLNNNWNLWAWECHNSGTTIAFKKANAPNVLYTSAGQGRWTVEFGGWNQDGITLYNTLVEELTTNREKLNATMVDDENGSTITKMDFLESAFL